MRLSISILLYFFALSQYLYGQDSISQINKEWLVVKKQILNRAYILKILSKKVSNQKQIDKKMLTNLIKLNTELTKHVDTLNLVDTMSISIASIKNSMLVYALHDILMDLEIKRGLNTLKEYAGLQGKLEGCEDELRKAIRNYNEVCQRNHINYLLFQVSYPNMEFKN